MGILTLGPSLDGRIKPMWLHRALAFAGLAEEVPCGAVVLTGTHAGGNAYYMTLSGTSQATAIASGVAGLTREFIREQVGPSPSSSLVKAALINGPVIWERPTFQTLPKGGARSTGTNRPDGWNDGS